MVVINSYTPTDLDKKNLYKQQKVKEKARGEKSQFTEQK